MNHFNLKKILLMMKKLKVLFGFASLILFFQQINNCSTIQQDINDLAFEGNLTSIKKKIKILKNVNFQDERGWTPLMAAVENNKKDVILYLLNEGAFIDIRNSSGDTALMRAVYMGHTDIVKLLLENGANRAIRAKNGYTPFQKACEKGNLEIAKLLFREPIDTKDKVYDSLKYNLFHLSIKKEDLNMMEWLSQKGVDLNAKAEDGRTPLMLALIEKKKKAIEFLVSKGASMNEISNFGETTSQLAQQTFDDEIITMISKAQSPAKSSNILNPGKKP